MLLRLLWRELRICRMRVSQRHPRSLASGLGGSAVRLQGRGCRCVRLSADPCWRLDSRPGADRRALLDLEQNALLQLELCPALVQPVLHCRQV